MEFLTKLLGVDVPENTALTSAELTFRGYLPVWLGILALVVLAGVILFLYTLERGTMGWPRRILMVLLRTALLALIVILMFRPVLLAEFRGERDRHISVLLDNSQSMKQQDRRVTEEDRARVGIAKGLLPLETNLQEIKSLANLPPELPKDPPRIELVQWVLTNPNLQLLEKLEKVGPLQPLLFGPRLYGPQEDQDKGKKVVDQLLNTFKGQDAATALIDGINEILQRKGGDYPAAMVVITDGQDNASKFTLQEIGQEAKRQQVPLFIYGVGTAEGGSLQLKEVQAPDTIFVEDTLSVPLRWRAQGFKKGTVEITLTLGGKLMAKKELNVQTGDDLRDVLSFTVEKGQKVDENFDLVTTIQLKGNDLFKDTMTRQVRVVDRKIKVLVIENSPRFEFKFLQPALLRDRRIEPTFLLVNADTKVANSGPPFIPSLPGTRDKFFEAKFDLIILGDVPASYLGREHMEWIKEFVQNRGGLIVIAGRQNMPTGYQNTPLAEVLPVEFEPVKFQSPTENRTQDYPPTLTDVGQRTGMLFLAETPEENLKVWQSLPGFFWHYPVTKLRAGAQPLVVNPRVKMGKQEMPIVATQFYGKGQVLYCGTDETWRWRFNVQDKHFVRYWGQIIYQLGLPHLLGDGAKRAQFGLEHAEALLNRRGYLYVRLLDKDFNPRKDAQVEAVLEYLDAKPGQERTRKITLQAIPAREGEYRVLLPHDQPGRFEVKVNNPEPHTYFYRVEVPPRHELEEAGLAEKALRELAQLSGGQFYREEDLHHLAQDVQQRKASFHLRQEVILWNPLALVLFVLLISAEWLVRKFSNLS
jgi:hypothetical protein